MKSLRLTGIPIQCPIWNLKLERLRKTSIQNKTHPTPHWQWQYITHRHLSRPNVMDMYHLSIEEREKHIKEKGCFNCQKIGQNTNLGLSYAN
jgi:hypothetical protein